MTSATITLPQKEGEWSPEEARAWMHAQTLERNLAGDKDTAQKALNVTTSVMAEWTERMTPLWRRWRATNHMLAGNTLEKGGPEDVHVPEIYKSMETLVPRVEEQIIEKDPWFGIIARRKSDRRQAATLAAYTDWQFDQAKIRSMVQPAIRDMLITQAAIFYVYWDNKKSWTNLRSVDRTFDEKGRMVRKVKIERKEIVEYSGPRAVLVDHFDFVIDPKATDPQNATFVGHRAWLTIDEIRRRGKDEGWINLSELENKTPSTSLGTSQDYYKWGRDPTARFSLNGQSLSLRPDGRPQKIEVVFLHTRLSLDGGLSYDDYRVVVAAGKVVLEVRVNPNDRQLRPYATMRVTKSGHEFYGTGPYDNAIRMSQHLDRYHQIVMRGSEVAGSPMVFAEEDSDLPDSLYKVRPFQVFKGVGAVRFTSVPDGFLRNAPMIIGMWQRNIEEVTGSFRLNMGQDSNGTATEASLSLQEGNRRTRGIIRAVGEGLEQLLYLFYRFTYQYSTEDVEFPVLGKRALDLRKTHASFSPADLLDDVKFDLIGLRSMRTYGLKATGMQAFTTAMTPFIMANPANIDQLAIMHDFASEVIGPDEADRYVKIPTPVDQLRSQKEENEGLITGTEIEIDPDDHDLEHLKDMEFLWDRALDPEDPMPEEVRRVIFQHRMQHVWQHEKKQAQQSVVNARQERTQRMLAPEAGGQANPETGNASPMAGGMSNAVASLGTGPPGQSGGENPGTGDLNKTSRSGRAGRPINQDANDVA